MEKGLFLKPNQKTYMHTYTCKFLQKKKWEGGLFFNWRCQRCNCHGKIQDFDSCFCQHSLRPVVCSSLLAVTAAARLALLLTLVGGIQVQAVQIEREKTLIQNTTARNTSKLLTDYYCSMIFATLIQYICLPFNA